MSYHLPCPDLNKIFKIKKKKKQHPMQNTSFLGLGYWATYHNVLVKYLGFTVTLIMCREKRGLT